MNNTFILLLSFFFICCEKNGSSLSNEQLLTSRPWTLHSRDLNTSPNSLNECVNKDRIEIKPSGEAFMSYSCEFTLDTTSGTWELTDDNKLSVFFLADSTDPLSQFPIIKGTITSLTSETLVIYRSDTLKYLGQTEFIISGTETWIH